MNGILIVDKPSGITSYDVIRQLKKLIPGEKIGHSGTLDPIATGILVILLGKFTKLATQFLADDKEYVFEATFGVSTDSQDSTGKVLETKPVDISKIQIMETMGSFRGEIEQIPPMISAKKHEGERLYKLARRGIEVKREPKKILIKEFEMLNLDADKAVFRVLCSKGTYVRTLCHDMGQKLGCGANMSNLKRTRSGQFNLEDAFTIEEIKSLHSDGKFKDAFVDLTLSS